MILKEFVIFATTWTQRWKYKFVLTRNSTYSSKKTTTNDNIISVWEVFVSYENNALYENFHVTRELRES